jgi:hypothetical protein
MPAGKRFQTLHTQQKDAPVWAKALMVFGAVLALAIGVLLTVLPGPAILFYALAAAFAGIQSAWIARALDRAEVAVRTQLARLQRWWSKRRSAPR